MKFRCLQFAVCLIAGAASALAQQVQPSPSTFKVKYVDVKTVYIDAGKNAGLAPGMTLTVKRSRVLSNYSGDGQLKGNLIVARLTVVSVSNNSAMCEIHSQMSQVRRGDVVFLPEPEPRPETPMEARSPVFKPAINEIDSEQEKRAPAAAGVSASRAPGPIPASSQKDTQPTSIAEAARANRRQPASAVTVQANTSGQPAPAPASPSPATATAAPTTAAQPGVAAPPAQVTANSEPLSLGEIARRNRNKSQPVSPRASQENTTAAAAAASVAPPPGNTTRARSLPTLADARAISSSPTSSAPVKAEVAPALPSPSAAKPLPPSSAPATVAVSKPAEPARADDRTAASASPLGKPADAKPALPAPVATLSAKPSTMPAEGPRAVASASTASASPEIARPAVPVAPATPTIKMAAAAASLPAAAEPVKIDFRVKYVAEDAIYIEGGKDAGLSEGMTLNINRSSPGSAQPQSVAEVTVVSVSNTSAVCEIKDKTTDIQRGDIALLSQADQQKILDARTLAPNRKYPVVIAFSQGDPLDEEAREAVPKPPSPEVNRARGRIGVDYSFINTRSAGVDTTTMQTGGVVRVDMSRIGGSYWNLNGYWRGRLNLRNSSSQPESVYDLVNRTYTIGLTYLNPKSHWTAGVGRLYLPWATSLDTIDGGYVGLKLGKHTTLGAFAGTTPDPASFDYNQDRRMAGSFVAFEGGSFDHFRFTSTEGVAVSAIEWREDRQFIFSENGLFYKRFLSIYHSAQADIQRLPTGGTTQGLSRSFATLRLQPFSRFSIDVNHNYFRDVPTFDPSLVGTGLLDKFLFQGVSAGGRLELPGRISLYNNIGQSNSSADAHSSLNQMYGITLGRLWKTGLRGDVRYSKFNSSFGQGNYRAASLSRNFSEIVRIEVNAGQQAFVSALGTPTNYRLLGSTVDLNLGGHYFIETSFNLQRSAQQNFDQLLTTFGYRFDSGRH